MLKRELILSNYELEKLLPKDTNTKGIWVIKDELGGKVMTEVFRLKPKTYSYLTENGDKNKKAKTHKKLCHRTKN